MNIDGLGEETVQLLYDSGLIADIADLYRLKREDLVDLPRLGEKSADNILNSIRKSLNVPFDRVLFAIGIRFVGETTAKTLAAQFKSLDALAAATPEELAMAEDIGERIAVSVRDYFLDPANLDILERLKASGLHFEAEESARLSDRLDGKKIVISGTFERHSRDQLKQLIEAHGGKNLGAVSSTTDYLLAGSNIGPAKLTKANKLGVKIIGEADFERIIAGEAVGEKEHDEIPVAEQSSSEKKEEPSENNSKQRTLFG